MPDTPSPAPRITENADGVTFSIHVQPRASRNEICGVQGEAIRLRLTSPPVEGEANRLCIEFLAKRLGVPRSSVSIIAGEKSRHKTIRVSGCDAAAVLTLLESHRR
jgi:hypothetical protein